MIGSPEEYAAPPTPAGYVARRQSPVVKQPINHRRDQLQVRTSQQPSSSIAWESEKENWKPKGRMQAFAPAPARKFDATITPLPTRQSPVPLPATQVPSNPGKMFFEGDKVIGQSSTMGRSNQYQGQRTTVGSVPSPTLLPELDSEPETRFPTTDAVPFQESSQLGSMRQLPPKKFSNAGFDRPDSSKTSRFNPRRTSPSGSRKSVGQDSHRRHKRGWLDRQTQSRNPSTSADHR